MKKFLAILCAAVLMLATMATALANPSISDLSEAVSEAATEAALPEGSAIKVQAPATANYANKAVAEVVDAVNNGDELVTVEEALAKLDSDFDGSDYDFITNFTEIGLALENADVVFDLDGEPVAVKVTLTIDALKGVAAEDLGDYKILVANPTSGEVAVVDLIADTFDSAAGTVQAELPFLGVFALIQKVI